MAIFNSYVKLPKGKVKFYKDFVHMLHGRFTLGEWPILLS